MAQRTIRSSSLMFPFLLEAEEVKAVPTRACHAMCNRAERGILFTVVFKAVREDRHSEDLPAVGALERRPGGRQSEIPIRRFAIALDLAPEALRRSQAQIGIVR